jgi:succinate dehydrogenase hydrophobic anchor subunit
MDGMISKPKVQEGVWLWLLKVLFGLVIAVLIAVHFIVNHLVASGGLLTYQDVINYYKNPGVTAMEIAFLIFVVSHALMGTRSIILDLNPSEKILKFINWGMLILGGAAIIYGIWLVQVIAASR